MRFRSGKEPTVDIEFNVLDRKKKLLLMSNLRATSLSRKPIARMKKMTMHKSGILMKKAMEDFCLFISAMTRRGYIKNMHHI